MNILNRSVLSLLFILTSLTSVEQEAIKRISFRTSFLQSFDKMLATLFASPMRTYSYEEASEGEVLQNRDPYILHFDPTYGYFSETRPLVGRVTENSADLTLAIELLLKIHNKILDPQQCEIMATEVITKLVAYRALKPGMIIPFPYVDLQRGPTVVLYRVDEVIDLWRGMPAFGLVPQKKGSAPPILLFRGTDFSLVTEKGWASIISDLEIHDPGLSTFHHGQPEIHAWLAKVAKQGEKARVMGFSLGGILAAYTLLYEGDLVNSQQASISYNAPGVSREILHEWFQASSRPPFLVFITDGDLVPKYGLLLGQTFLLMQEELPAPLKAHTELITLSSFYRLQNMSPIHENETRKN